MGCEKCSCEGANITNNYTAGPPAEVEPEDVKAALDGCFVDPAGSPVTPDDDGAFCVGNANVTSMVEDPDCPGAVLLVETDEKTGAELSRKSLCIDPDAWTLSRNGSRDSTVGYVAGERDGVPSIGNVAEFESPCNGTKVFTLVGQVRLAVGGVSLEEIGYRMRGSIWVNGVEYTNPNGYLEVTSSVGSDEELYVLTVAIPVIKGTNTVRADMWLENAPYHPDQIGVSSIFPTGTVADVNGGTTGSPVDISPHIQVHLTGQSGPSLICS